MKILVTGAQGFLGRTLLDLPEPVEWYACGRRPDTDGLERYHQVDLTQERAVVRLVEETRPDWIINAAAMTNVDRCQEEVEQARRLNVETVEHLCRGAERVGAGVLHLSTDYVFDGRDGPYTERDAPHPLSVYGRTKLDSERLLLERCPRAVVVRTLWLYGYLAGARPNFVVWALQALHRGETVRAFSDQWGNPTYAMDLARVLVRLCRAEARGIYNMGGATFMTRYELVVELAREFGQDPGQVVEVATEQAGLAAPRPLRSGLITQAVESLLDIRPMSFAEGLAHMRGQADFRRDFAYLL